MAVDQRIYFPMTKTGEIRGALSNQSGFEQFLGRGISFYLGKKKPVVLIKVDQVSPLVS